MVLYTKDSSTFYTSLALEGKLDAWTVNSVQDQFYRETVGMNRSAVIDMSGVIFMASLGIRMLVEAAKKLNALGHSLVILKPTPMVEKSLEITGLHRIIEVTHDENSIKRFGNEENQA